MERTNGLSFTRRKLSLATLGKETMKQKISITIDEKLLKKIDAQLDGITFRNRSHLTEVALNKMLEEKQ